MFPTTGLVNRQCKRTCDRYQFFDEKMAVEKLTGLVLVGELIDCSVKSSETSVETSLPSNHVSCLHKFFCTLCNVQLDDTQKMRNHFKTDWHLNNINRSLKGLSTLSLELFNELTQNQLDSSYELVDNFEKQDTNDESFNTLDHHIIPLINASSHKQMLFFRNRNSEIIGINRCILFPYKTMPYTMDELLACVSKVRQSRKWAILLYSGGKFAGGIFNGTQEVVHKTLQHYTVRSKQGGGQSSYDSFYGGLGGPKSAGANLRRHGETAIRNEISDLLHNKWRAQLQSCQLIFLWSPKVHRGIFFTPPASSSTTTTTYNHKITSENCDSNQSNLSSVNMEIPIPDPLAFDAYQLNLGMIADDARIRRIPCRSKNITYTYVKELHKELSTFDVYDSDADLDFLSKSSRAQWKHISESGDKTLLETKSGRLFYGPLNLFTSTNESHPKSYSSSSDSSSPSCFTESVSSEHENLKEQNESIHETISNQSCSNFKSVDNNEKDRFENTHNNTDLELFTNYQTWHRRVRVAIASGDCVILKSLLPDGLNNSISENESNCEASINADQTCESKSLGNLNDSIVSSPLPPVDMARQLLNHPLADGRNLLHVSVEFQSDPQIIYLLLECGCDPASTDFSGITPYQLSVKLHKKLLANTFRRFRFSFPNRYDYEKAQIPCALDPVKQAAKSEKRKEKLKRQKQRLKEKLAIERVQAEKRQKELEEQARFLSLSDREKRALAAERRLNTTRIEKGEPIIVFCRCYQCGCDITGKIPFTYLDYSFCSPNCVKQHRLTKKQ